MENIKYSARFCFACFQIPWWIAEQTFLTRFRSEYLRWSTTKPTKSHANSYQPRHVPSHFKVMGTFFRRTAKTVIRPGKCPGWSELSLGAQIFLLILSCYGSFTNLCPFLKKMSHVTTKPTKWLCAQRRHRSAWAFAQSDQSLWVAKDTSFLPADSEDSDQTGWMPRLIWVFAGCTCHFVCFVMRWLKC